MRHLTPADVKHGGNSIVKSSLGKADLVDKVAVLQVLGEK